MKITLEGNFHLDGSPATLTWEDGKIVADSFALRADWDLRVLTFGGTYVKAPWGPVKADPKTAEGFFVLAAPLFDPPPEIPDFGPVPVEEGLII